MSFCWIFTKLGPVTGATLRSGDAFVIIHSEVDMEMRGPTSGQCTETPFENNNNEISLGEQHECLSCLS